MTAPHPAFLSLALALMQLTAGSHAWALIGMESSYQTTSEKELQQYVQRVWKQDTFPYWAHLGRIDRSTGIYLGHGQVLTAAHVGEGAFIMPDGRRYEPVAGTARFFKNQDGSVADLCLFRIHLNAGDPLTKLAPVHLSTQAPKSGTSLMLLAGGAGSCIETATGYTWSNDYRLRWGVNAIHEVYSSPMPTNIFASYGFATRYDKGPDRCQAAPGDSGGAAFHFNADAGQWELAGIIVAVDSEFGRADYGNQTYIADPALFREQVAEALDAAKTLLASH